MIRKFKKIYYVIDNLNNKASKRYSAQKYPIHFSDTSKLINASQVIGYDAFKRSF